MGIPSSSPFTLYKQFLFSKTANGQTDKIVFIGLTNNLVNLRKVNIS